MDLFNKRLIIEYLENNIYTISDKGLLHREIIEKIVNFLKQDPNRTKEKSIQSIFLQRIFEQILEYPSQLSGEKKYNLLIEPTADYDSSEPDGILGFFDLDSKKTKAVIELKSTKIDLDKKQLNRKDNKSPVEQAFGYSYKFDGCKWVIVSNFKEIRLYNSERGINFYQKFNVLDLIDEKEFRKFYFIFRKNNFISLTEESLIEKLAKETNLKEENITKEFYNKYKYARKNLYEYLSNDNPQINKNIILEKTQKIIDRVIFISFCEDLGLLPYNILRNILKLADDSYDLSEHKLWNQLKGLFQSINLGNINKNINKFNGGLFANDVVLDNLSIKDEILKELIKISDYDFESDLNVNILGHIFEQSISDIEEMKADINELKTVKKEGKQKKEGIYYTPEYITKYIIEQAVGVFLEDRKEELDFNRLPELSEEDYENIKIAKGKVKANVKIEAHINFWESYREILQNIKVLDPACGSGAFLIQVFDYLYKEGQLVNDELAKLKKGQRQIFDLDKHILTNNIYGVDLNEESVEITKLSLWLKTANKSKELTSLDENIKCGNSIIDDPIIAGNKAFSWNEEFKEILIAGGFDVIIGNPPYGAELTLKQKAYLNSKYKVEATETAILFIIKSFSLLKNNGLIGLIVPKSFCFASNYKKIREITDNYLTLMIDCGKVWKEVKLEQNIIIFNRTKKRLEYLSGNRKNTEIKINDLISKIDSKFFGFLLNGVNNKEIALAKKIKENSINLNDISYNYRGIILYDLLSEDGYYEVIGGAEINKYEIRAIRGKIEKEKVYSENGYIKNNSLLVQGIVAHIENPVEHIQITAYIPQRKDIVIADNINQITIREDYSPYFIWAILQSKLLNWYAYRFIYGKAIRTMRFDNPVTSRLPILNTSPEFRKKIETNAREMINLYKDFKSDLEKSLNIFKVEYKFKKNTTKLKNFYNFNFEDFILELNKQGIKLTLEQKDKLYEWFHIKKEKLKNQEKDIYRIKQEIDQELYKLYNFSIEEIKTIENAQI